VPGNLLLKVDAGGDASIGQAQSAVSNNNFITVSGIGAKARRLTTQFCQGKTLTNGQQVEGGSCG
jgi:hypothetical protein